MIQWNDNVLKDQFYKGLKDAIKDELLKRNKPELLEELIMNIMEINNRFYKRMLERQGIQTLGSGRTSFLRRNGQWPQPMELDATL
jgi:hypothetical protein